MIAANGSEKVLKPGTRADSGPGACVNAGILAALGGEDAIVGYRGLSFAGAVRRDSALRLAFAVMLLTAVSTAATATVSWVKNTADSNDIVVNAAPIVAFLSFASAALKLWKDYNDL